MITALTVLSLLTAARAEDEADDEEPTLEIDAPDTGPQEDSIRTFRLAEGPYALGFGLIVGKPTGLSVGWRPSERHCINGAVAWSIAEGQLHLHTDYTITLFGFRDPAAEEVLFPLYTGIGGRLHVGDGRPKADPLLGVRVPIGLAVVPDAIPVDGFIEIVPGIGIYPETEFIVDGAIGARVFFF